MQCKPYSFKKYLNGSSLIVSNSINDYFQLFFVSSYVEQNEGIIFEYFFKVKNPTMSSLIKLCLNNVGTREKVFWVNLVETRNYFTSINIINYQASTIDEYVFGKKSPTIISLPVHQPKVEFVYKFQNYNESNTSKHNYHNR